MASHGLVGAGVTGYPERPDRRPIDPRQNRALAQLSGADSHANWADPGAHAEYRWAVIDEQPGACCDQPSCRVVVGLGYVG